MLRRRAPERHDLRVARASQGRGDDREDHPDVDPVEQPEGHEKRRDGHVDVERQAQVDHVVLVRGDAVGRAGLPHDAVARRTGHVRMRERHLDVVQVDAPQRLEVEAVDVRADEHAAATEGRGPLTEHGAGRPRCRNRHPGFEPKRRAAAGGDQRRTGRFFGRGVGPPPT